MKKFVCPVCGYVYEGEFIPEGFKCPVCGVDGSRSWRKASWPPSMSTASTPRP